MFLGWSVVDGFCDWDADKTDTCNTDKGFFYLVRFSDEAIFKD